MYTYVVFKYYVNVMFYTDHSSRENHLNVVFLPRDFSFCSPVLAAFATSTVKSSRNQSLWAVISRVMG